MSITITTLRTTAVTLAALAALATTAGGADAATQTRVSAVRPTAGATTTAIQAVPTDESSKQQRQKCTQWTNRLQAAQGVTLHVDGVASLAGPSPAVEALADQAMSDGCFVIY